MTTNPTIDGVPLADLEAALKADASRGATASELVAGWAAMERLRALLDARHPSEDELIANGLGYPFSKQEAVQLYYSGFKTEPITVLEAWDAIGHDIGCNPSKEELLDSLRNMAAICDAHGNDMPAAQPQGEPVAWSYKVRVHAAGIGLVWRDKVEHEAPDTNAVDVKDLSPLYAEQPAPVAVVLPERKPSYDPINHPAYQHGWNACLDEVARLNTK
ncbi:hypothetical protein M1B34_31885 [Pseudomonas sp. MAFF 302030]|uniref:Uncharacterized protein n=1 Tax=Pseudomonas morbosilactucae TaxID=2938197 RepID=A0A9X1Z3A5_9PSED|nr:hypothetical protein [Pseudomonas morbosilactucae]MCK9802139.1 hypothetical protein [Pseudomonas morbosilactucae]